jgi:hydroxyacylglutathione hydrolase
LELILLTHNHIYHTQGLRAIRKRLTAKLAIHESDNQNWLPFRPDVILNGKDILTIGKVKIEAIYTPGHTPGSMCFRIGKYLMVGDTLLPDGPGKTTDPEAFQLIIKSITEKIFILPDDIKIYPGHGRPTNLKKAKKEYNIFASHQHSPSLCGDVRWVTS